MNDDMQKRSWNDLAALKAQKAAQDPSPENLRESADVDNIARGFNIDDE